MKHFLTILIVLSLTVSIYAVEVSEKKVGANHQVTLTFSEDEYNALETSLVSVTEWAQNWSEVYLNQVMRRAIAKDTIYNPNKMSKSEKMTEFKKLNLPKAITRNVIPD